MFAAAEGMFMYVESSCCVGSGEDRLEVDVPIQREAATGYPLCPGSSLKGVLRNRARSQQAPVELLGLLGSPPESEEPQPSSVVVSDALPLLFPVRSLTGLFAWVTSLEVWSRFQPRPGRVRREGPSAAATAGHCPRDGRRGSPSPARREQGNAGAGGAELSGHVVAEAGALGAWLADHAFPDEPVFDFWRQRAMHGVVILPEGAYRYFVTHATQVVPQRIRTDPRHRDGKRRLAVDRGIISHLRPCCTPWWEPICLTPRPPGSRRRPMSAIGCEAWPRVISNWAAGKRSATALSRSAGPARRSPAGEPAQEKLSRLGVGSPRT